MKIGLLCAIAEEGYHILREMQIRRRTKKLKTEFIEGKFLGTDIVVVIGGMGKVSSALCTQILIDHFNVEVVIFSGIAGGLNRNLGIGDTVIGTETLYHDVDRAGKGIDLNTLHSFFRNRFQTDAVLLDRVRTGLQDVEFTAPALMGGLREEEAVKVIFGRILTGDQVITSSERVRYLRESLEGDCVEMEGAAVAQTCVLNERPFLIIRTISDLADEEAMTTVMRSMDAVVDINYRILKEIIRIITSHPQM